MKDKILRNVQVAFTNIWNTGLVQDGLIVDTKNIIMDKDRSLLNKIWTVTWRGGTVIALTAACIKSETVQSADVPNQSDPYSFIPTPNPSPETSVLPKQFLTETYQSDDIAMCVFHQFNDSGEALAPRAIFNCKTSFDSDNNIFIVSGESFIRSDKDVSIYPVGPDGKKGYESLQVIPLEDFQTWTSNMSAENQAKLQPVITDATQNNSPVRVLMKTVLNIQPDANGQDRLVDMDLGIAVSIGGENAKIVILGDKLDPITKLDLLKDQQIASIDFGPSTTDFNKVTMEVYPNSWIEIGNGEYVSPEFIELQDQIGASGERFTLMPNGTIQEKTGEGVNTIPNLLVDKRGIIKIIVNGQEVILERTTLQFEDNTGLSIEGYTYNAETNEWESPLPVELPGNMAKIFKDISGKDISQMSDAELVQFSKDHMKEVLDQMEHFQLTVLEDGSIDPEQLKALMEKGRQDIETYNLADVFNHMKNKNGEVVPIEQIVPEKWIGATIYRYTGVGTHDRLSFTASIFYTEPQDVLGWSDYTSYWKTRTTTSPYQLVQTNAIHLKFVDSSNNVLTEAIASPVIFLDSDENNNPIIINSFTVISLNAFEESLNSEQQDFRDKIALTNGWRFFAPSTHNLGYPTILSDIKDTNIESDIQLSDPILGQILVKNNAWFNLSKSITFEHLPEEINRTLFSCLE